MTSPLQLHALDGEQLNGKVGPSEHRALHFSKGQETRDLGDLRPCLFPNLDSTSPCNGRWQSTEVPFRDIARLHSFGKEHKVSSLTVLQLAWALVLRSYVEGESVYFGCNVSSEETVMSGLSDTCNSPIRYFPCYVEFGKSGSLLEALRRMQEDSSKPQIQLPASLPVDVVGKAKTQHTRLFDTAVLYLESKQQNHSTASKSVMKNGAVQGLSEVSDKAISHYLFISKPRLRVSTLTYRLV